MHYLRKQSCPDQPDPKDAAPREEPRLEPEAAPPREAAQPEPEAAFGAEIGLFAQQTLRQCSSSEPGWMMFRL